MRAAAISSLALAACLTAGCAGVTPDRRFQAIGNFETAPSRSRAEGGQAEVFVPPPGISWSAKLDAYAENARDEPPQRRYELSITLVERFPGADPRLQPGLAEALLVDDEGGRYPATRIVAPEGVSEDETRRAETWRVIFDLPGDYRLRSIGRVAIHWRFTYDGEERRVTSLFRT